MTTTSSSSLSSAKVFIVAGEASGDLLGADLMSALQTRGIQHIMGIGGEKMTAQGLTSLFPMVELSVMGILEVLPRIFLLRRRIHQTIQEICAQNPEAVVLIDAPGFTHRVAKGLKQAGFTNLIIQYVAPSVWAWRPGRAKKLAKLADHLLTLLPFEPPYFEAAGLKTTFVGHPVATRQPPVAPLPTTTPPTIAILVGSRWSEVNKMLPIYIEALTKLAAQRKIRVIFPTFTDFAPIINQHAAALTCPWTVITTNRERALTQSSCALATSGTITLELSTLGIPTVVAFKTSWLTYALVRPLVRTQFVSLTNILLQEAVLPEWIQSRCTAHNLCKSMQVILDDQAKKDYMKRRMADAIALITPPEGSAGSCSATTVCSLIERKKVES